MTVQVSYARRPLARKQSFAGLNSLGPDQFEGYASLFEVPDGAGDVVAPGAFAASLRRRGPGDVRLLYHTPRLGLPDLPDTPELYAETVSDAFWRLDALCDLYLKGQFVNTPPSSPADGDAWLTGGAPTGAWSGYAYKIAACRDGGWQFLTPFDGLRAWVDGTGCFIVYQDGTWTDWNALISAAEGSIASAATCDIGAAGSLFLQVTGTATITAFGTTPNKQRFLRFAGALTLTHNATSLILPGAANITTAAGDCALFASDAGGNWCCRQYSRASGLPVSLASPTVTGTLTAAAANFSGNIGIGTTAGTTLHAFSAETAITSGANGVGTVNAAIMTSNAATQDYGGTLGLGGYFNGTSQSQPFGAIAGRKTNGTAGDARGYLALYANNNSNLFEGARLSSDGSFLVGTATGTGAGTIGTQVCTVAALPAGAKGARAFVSDASSVIFNATAAGGGSNNVPVFHDGSGWRIG